MKEPVMHPMHPALAEAHAQARVEQMRRQAPSRSQSGYRMAARRQLRTSAGWFLINVGFRLVQAPGPVAPAAG